jgi:hypothetical protein
MDDLKLHVERIVRPVRATQSRKLRMRRELLAHLHAALTEERANSPDEATAMERPTQRLGTPEELSRTLQKSVPLIQRILLAKLEKPKPWGRQGAVERWEFRAARRLWALDAPMTLWHSSILLMGATVLPYAALLSVVWMVPPSVYLRNQLERPAAAAIVNLINTIVSVSLFIISARLMVLVSSAPPPLSPPHARRAIRYVSTIVASPLLLTYMCVAVIAGRAVTPALASQAIIVGAVLAFSMFLIGRLLGALRRPYDEWLRLDVASA